MKEISKSMMIIMIINIYTENVFFINDKSNYFIIIVVIYNNKIRFNSVQLNSQAEYQR